MYKRQGLVREAYDGSYGIPADLNKSLEWMRKAAKAGNRTEQYNLGLVYDEGKGVAVDYRMAAYWYRKADAKGLAKASYNLGLLYLDGHGVTKNPIKATQLFSKAAQAGDSLAANMLAISYRDGTGVIKDAGNCYYWGTISVALGTKSNLPNQCSQVSYLPASEVRRIEERAQRFLQSI